ncbi:hypothetical protein BGZ99_004703 [Dissophora globulifera]|uniref:FAD-binding domain-containing protein n=1 Tax=Dissophora globulifera TaxID=979702 RepID=A0A9P6RLP7_9FUNG|nr:hypothetical protein BGZ99_004703 [Dissophora globulifera]
MSHSVSLKPLPQAHAPQACYDPAYAVPFDLSILTIGHKKDHTTIKALIIGGGIAGLALAIMMDLAGIEFEILEGSTGHDSSMTRTSILGPPVLRLLEQMDLLPQIEAISKPINGLNIIDGESNKRMGRIEGIGHERYGYPIRVCTREDFYQVLLARVPKRYLHTGKQVVETTQNANGASCRCADGSTYYGDIIVGADGSRSVVREKMYTALKEKSRLPEPDLEPSCYEHGSIGGVTTPLDKSIYPTAHDASAELMVIYTKDAPYTFWYLPVSGNRVSWGINNIYPPKYSYHSYSRHVATSLSQDEQLYVPMGNFPTATSSPRVPIQVRGSKVHHDWSAPPDIDLEASFKDLLDVHCAIGPGTVRDFIKHTPKQSVQMIDQEERVWKTWYHGRMVLIGDACHQSLMSGGQGTVQALLDGVCLVNLLYDMEYKTPDHISKVFKKYQSERSKAVKVSIENTSQTDNAFHGQGIKATLMRKLLFNTAWTFSLKSDKFNNYRPQLSFLPFVEDRGTSKANKQKIAERLSGKRSIGF